MTRLLFATKGERASEMPTRGFKKIVLSRKSDYIVEQIYEALLRGDLKPVQRLSSESELAETFGVSKLTVREAVRSLEQMGIVEVRKGGSGGLFIREADLSSTVKQLENILRIPHITVPDLTETRIALETYILRECLPHRKISQQALARLENNISLAEQYFNEGKNLERLRTNFEFHVMLSSLTDNNMLIIVHRLTCDMLIRFFQLARPSHEMFMKTLDYHRKILAAIRDRQFDKAALLNAEHMQGVSKKMTEKSKRQSYLPSGE
jgi:GntR family transcriptional regulator, transcriptional repressor for pyruvate dehydrogenase complex